MPIEITMPALSPTMTEGNLAKWVKQEGDKVKPGDVIAEIETDKATMEVEAVDEGTLAKIMVAEGAQGVKVGAVIAVVLEEGESADAIGAPKAVPAPKPAAAPAPQAAAPVSQPAASPAPVAVAPHVAEEGARLFASPLAKRLAAEAGIDIKSVQGSGPHGRIVKADVEARIAGGAPAAKPVPAVAAPTAASSAAPAPGLIGSTEALTKEKVAASAGNIPYELVPHTGMRRTIARRMTESHQTIPDFFLTIECNIDELMKIRAELNSRGGDKYKLSVNDFVIRASALAMRKVPAVNASWSDEGMMLWQRVDIGIAVAIENGLITPIIKDADTKGLATISNQMRDMGARAKTGKLKLEEFQGGTFSISNLGMFGIKEFSAVVNPPHSAILAVGVGEQRPIVEDGALAIATMMSCTMSCDHRVIDGATGAIWLQEFKKLMEDPLTMLL